MLNKPISVSFAIIALLAAVMSISPVKATIFLAPPYADKWTLESGSNYPYADANLTTGRMNVLCLPLTTEDAAAQVKMWKRIWCPAGDLEISYSWKLQGYLMCGLWLSHTGIELYIFVEKSLNSGTIHETLLFDRYRDLVAEYQETIDEPWTSDSKVVSIPEDGYYNIGAWLAGAAGGLLASCCFDAPDGAWVSMEIYTSSGGGCPYVSTWDGDEYVLDNNLLPTSLANIGVDVEDYYRLEQSLVRRRGKYWLKISEFQNEHSYIDQVRLFAVDHESDVNVAVTETGEILTYKEPFSPVSCVDNNGIDRLSQVALMDGDVIDPDTYYYGDAGDYLIVNFGEVDSDYAKLIVRDDMICKICCIEVQILSDGEWQTVAVIAPRDFWSMEAVDLSPYVMEDGDFTVKLVWTSAHRLDYVGLDTSDPEEFEIQIARLVSATRSEAGDVKEQLLHSDDVYAELLPGQEIELTFILPKQTMEARDYIIVVEGRYYTISP